MSFTNLSLVKKHISEHHIGTTQLENISAHLVGTSPFQLPHVNILFGSEKLKAKEMIAPLSENITFYSDIISLSHAEIIPDSVVVASDSSLGQIYIENLDFSINYEEGKIIRIPSGSISSGAGVVVWYLYYRLYTRDTDYKIDYATGQITRISNGAIEDGQWVLVDYTVEYGFLTDDIITNAMVEAGDLVTKIIDTSYLDSTEQGLVTAETYLTVSILCRIKGMDVMNQNISGSNALALSKLWSQIGDVYEEKSRLILNSYAKARGNLSSPTAVSPEN